MSTYEHIGPDSDDEEAFPTLQHARDSRAQKMKELLVKLRTAVGSREFLTSLAVGQMVSLWLCGTAVFSGLLQEQGVHTPTAQSFFNYVLLCLVFTVMLACRQDDQGRHLGIILRQDGWKYALLALIDVEANYLVVKAYSYTTVTSVQLLDCFSIFVVVLLSWRLLKAHYRWLHLVGVAVTLLGLGGLILADVFTGRNNDASSDGSRNMGLGDFLVIVGASLYGVSNVAQEFIVKNYPKSDFLGMIGMFGSIISGVQLVILERDEVAKLDLSSYKIWMPWMGFVICLFLVYTCMTVAIQKTSATTINISILSADFYALLFGLVIFHYKFHILYIVAFLLIMLGIFVYSLRPVGEVELQEQHRPLQTADR